MLKVRVEEEDEVRLRSLAMELQVSLEAAASVLLHEKLREEGHRYIEFRSSGFGRQAYVKGHRLAVWEVVHYSGSASMDAAAYADHLGWPVYLVEAALAYAAAYPDEIIPVMNAFQEMTFEDLKRLDPSVREVHI